jgi:hypothetical protein
MKPPEVTAEHAWLMQLVGQWTFDQGEEGMRGTETVRALGEIWIEAHSQATCGGMAMTFTVTLGFDPERKKFVGTWVGSMMTHLWIFEGDLSEDRRSLTLSTMGPSMKHDGSMANFRDVISLHEDGSRSLTSFHQDETGDWKQFMDMRLTRVA